MSQMTGPDDNNDDGTDEIREAAFRAATDTLIAAFPELEDVARPLGLYAAAHMIVPATIGHPAGGGGPVPALSVQFDIGEVAFSDRVQNPDAAAVNQTFREIEADAAVDDYLDTRARIERNLAAGRDAFDDGDGT